MKHLRRINESEHPAPYTWDELLYLIENDEVKFVGCEEEDVLDSIKGYIDRVSNPKNSERPWYNPDISTSPVNKNSKTITSLGDSLIIFDASGKPVAIMSEYEMMNPFVFGDVVICPGHDAISCFNTKTGEHTRQYIR